MIKQLKRTFHTVLLFSIFTYSYGADIKFNSWKFNNLDTIGGIVVSTEGNPEIISINKENAYLFDGTTDRVVIENNPLQGLDEFTIEIVFRVDKGGIAEQKFFHLQASPDIRILFELEFKNDSMWYMDNYIRSGNGECMNFIDSTKLYPVNRWYHAALVYKNKTFKHYINYQTEGKASLNWTPPTDGAVSVGARMNQQNYMTGAVREIRFANVALDSSQFLFYGEQLESSETFILDNLNEINGHTIQHFGDPQVVETEIGPGIDFDGSEDGIYIFANPIADHKYFTIETIIKPNDVYPSNSAPRYFHIEEENGNRRITMELRLNDKHEWYFDGYLRASRSKGIVLIDETLTHPIDGWEHIAITYNNGEFKTYVNYRMELDSLWGPHFLPLRENTKMSVGMRMNKVSHFNGIIQRIRITHAVLDPSEFMKITPDSSEVVTTVNSETL